MQKDSTVASSNKVFNQISIGLLCLSVFIGSFLRFWNLDRESFWGDEIYSALAATSSSLKNMFTVFVSGDVHPPLYFILLRGWACVFGSSEWALRLSSVVASIAAFFFMYYLTKKVLGQQVAMLATLLLIFSTVSIVYAQELRSYSFLLLFSVITTLLWLHLVYQFQSSISSRYFVVYTIIAIITSYLHYFGFGLVGFQVGYLILLNLLYKCHGRQVCLVFVGWLALFLPWLVYQLDALTATSGGVFWIKRWPFGVFLKEFIAFVFFCGHPERFLYRRILFISLFLLVVLYMIRSWNKLPVTKIKELLTPLVPLVYLMAVPYITIFLVSYHTPLLEARFLIILLPAFYLGLAYFLNVTLPSYETAFILVFAIWGSLACVYTVRAGNKICKQQWREATTYALQVANEDVAIVLLQEHNTLINMNKYYLEQLQPHYSKRTIRFSESSLDAIKVLVENAKNNKSTLIFLRTAVPGLSADIERLLMQQATTYTVKEFHESTVYVCGF